MAAVKARRGGRGHEPQRPRRRRPAPPPLNYDSMPRLAQIKLSGGISGDDMQVSSKSLMLGLASLVFFVGAAVAVAAWLGSSLFDAREAFARSTDAAAAGAGFAADNIEVVAMPDAPAISAARAAEVRALVVPQDRQSILSLEPADVKARVESLDWVASARVRRLWPSTLRVEVQRRQAYALWQEEGQVSVIDANGERLLAERSADHQNLPLVVGAGAGPASTPILAALESLPNVRARVERLVRVHDRRWDVRLTSGATIALPEQHAPEALARLEALQDRYALLDRPVDRFDLRVPGRLAVRVHPQLAGGPDALIGGV